jgi:hypothetical protein
VGQPVSFGRALTNASAVDDDDKLVVHCSECNVTIVTTKSKHAAILNKINDSKPANSKMQTTVAYRHVDSCSIAIYSVFNIRSF